MKLIVEGYPYKSELVGKILQGLDAPQNQDGFVRVGYVGYFYNNHIKDCVFFLPKVVLNENDKVLEKYSPEGVLNVEDNQMVREDRDFIYGLSVWIYRAVREFQRLNSESEIVYQNTFSRIDGSQTKVENTLIDVILSLLRFNNENRDFFMFTVKNIHSGYNKINWARTIASKTPLMQNDSPVYLNVVNKKKQVNFDEELLIIYFSILEYIHQKYGFRTRIDYNYELITGSKFENWLRGYGKLRLLQIKYKYFSDKALALWKHCYAFFELSELINSSRQQNDYLLVKDFNIVFEAIIDELLSDKELKKGELVEQPDGKRVDHMYAYDGLINNNERIYYIGDSKYYKIGSKPGETSVYKQYTYARNVIQYNLNLFLKGIGEKGKDYLIYRDPETEGYNITPNFFISARLNNDYSYDDDDLTFNGDEEPLKHFENRLFDRDTLLLQRYDVNFLFVVALYAGSNDYAKQEFKTYAQNKFREQIIDYLEQHYQFFSLQKRPDRKEALHSIVNRSFRDIIGKTFRPYNEDDILYLSCEKDEKYTQQNIELITTLTKDFIVRDYKLGTDPRKEINEYTHIIEEVQQEETAHVLSFADFMNEVFLIGGYRSDKNQLKWILEKRLYNVREGVTRNGNINTIREVAMAARFVVLYDLNDESHSTFSVYIIGGHRGAREATMADMGYNAPHGNYHLYEIASQLKFRDFNLDAVIEEARIDEMLRRQHEDICNRQAIQAGKAKPLAHSGWEKDWYGTPIYKKGADVVDILERNTSGRTAKFVNLEAEVAKA